MFNIKILTKSLSVILQNYFQKTLVCYNIVKKAGCIEYTYYITV